MSQRVSYVILRLVNLHEEEYLAFQKLFSGIDIVNKPEFSEWEDKHHYKQALENEYLYWQGMKDGCSLYMPY